MTTFYQNENMQGITILQRPHEVIQDKKYNRLGPFISTVVTDLNPIGLPPIVVDKQIFREQKENKVSNKNRKIIKTIQKFKKREAELEKEEKTNNEKKLEKFNKNRDRINKEIEEIRMDMYGSTENLDNKDGNSIKLNPKYHNFKSKLEKAEQNEINELVNFAENLDFEKYMKDLEIREALQLIKLRVDVDNKEEQERLELQKKEDEKLNLNANEEYPDNKALINDLPNNKEEAFPQIDSAKSQVNNNVTPIEHEKDWNDVFTKHERDEQKSKKDIIERCLKSEINYKHLHSKNSIQKILEREGLLALDSYNTLSKLRISNIDTRGNLHTGKPEGMYKYGLLQNIIQNPDIHL